MKTHTRRNCSTLLPSAIEEQGEQARKDIIAPNHPRPWRHWWRLGVTLLLASLWVFCHGCHGDEDDEPFAALRAVARQR
ncbi:MAG: hypothetical protein ACK4RK_19755 [Gemmataceae bacterium]